MSFLWWAYVQVMWCSPIQLHAHLSRQTNNGNLDYKQSWNPNIPPKPLDKMYFINRNISNIANELISCKYTSNLYPSRCDILANLVWIAWVGASPIPTGNSYPFVSIVKRILRTKYKCIYCTFQGKFYKQMILRCLAIVYVDLSLSLSVCVCMPTNSLSVWCAYGNRVSVCPDYVICTTDGEFSWGQTQLAILRLSELLFEMISCLTYANWYKSELFCVPAIQRKHCVLVLSSFTYEHEKFGKFLYRTEN